MGIIHSKLRNKKRQLLKDTETINNSIKILAVLRENLKQEIVFIEQKKNFLNSEIKDQNRNLFRLCNKVRNLDNEPIDKLECKICMEKQIEFIAIPCGHTFCNLCSIGLQVCHICRAPITNFNKIFI